MTRRKSGEESIRRLTTVGQTSLAVTIPLSIVNELKLENKQKVVVRREGKKIVIEDWKE